MNNNTEFSLSAYELMKQPDTPIYLPYTPLAHSHSPRHTTNVHIYIICIQYSHKHGTKCYFVICTHFYFVAINNIVIWMLFFGFILYSIQTVVQVHMHSQPNMCSFTRLMIIWSLEIECAFGKMMHKCVNNQPNSMIIFHIAFWSCLFF